MSEAANKISFTLQRANAAAVARDYVSAIRLYTKALKSDENNTDILIKLGSAYVSAGDDENALGVFTSVLEKEPDNFDALNYLSGIYRRLGRFEESIKMMEQVRDRDSKAGAVDYNMGYTYRLMKQYDKAAECFMNVIDSNPNDVLAYNHLGCIEDLRGNHDKAIAAFSRGLQVDPNHPVLHYNVALSLASQGKDEEAEKHFQAALRSKPTWSEAAGKYADLLLHMKETEKAKDILLQDIKLNPANESAYNKLGRLYLKQDDFENAELTYSKVLKLNAENTEALNGLSKAYEKQKKYTQASDILEKLEILESGDERVAVRYAKVLIALDRLYDAALRLKRVYDKNSNDIAMLNVLSQYFIRNGEIKKAYTCCKHIRKLDPKANGFLKDNAEQFVGSGMFEDAERFLKEYVHAKPDDAEAWNSLGSCYESLKKYKKALAAWKHSLDLNANNTALIKRIGVLSRHLSEDKEAMSVITDVLNKNNGAELNLDAVRDSISARENAFAAIEEADVPSSFQNAGQNLAGAASGAKENVGLAEIDEELEPIDFPDITEQTERYNDFTFDDFKVQSEQGIDDEYDPLELIENKEELTQEKPDDEYFDLSQLLPADSPLDFEKADENSAAFDEFDGKNSKSYEPLEEQEFMDIDGSGFEAESEKVEDPVTKSEPQAAFIPTEQSKAKASESEVVPQTEDNPASAENPAVQEEFEIEPAIEQNGEAELLQQAADGLQDAAEGMEKAAEMQNENLQGLRALAEKYGDCKKENELSDEADAEETGNNTDSEDDIIAQADDENLTSDEVLMEKVRTVLKEVFDKPPVAEFKSTCEMFGSLRNLCSFLPEQKKDEFFSSLNRVKLEYVIDRLLCKPGLLTAAQALHTSGLAEPVPAAQTLHGSMLLKHTLSYMNSLMKNLPDKGHAAALSFEVKRIDEKLK